MRSESTQSERLLEEALRRQARPGEVILPAVRFSDPSGGDVEADFLILVPDLGAAVIEVKGGRVEYAEGTWTLHNRRGGRRIHPTRQARQARHALRRYLDRQPEWRHGLLRSAWLVAFPQTDVDSDMGPEARRELIVDRSDLPRAMDRIRELLGNPLDADPVPPDDWCGEVVSLLLRAPLGQVAGSGATAVDGVSPGSRRRSRRRVVLGGAIAVAVALVIGAGAWLAVSRPADPVSPRPASPAGESSCAPGYQPCLPVVADLDCSEVRQQVSVTGDDPYGLDRDGDGLGCTMFAP